MNITFEKACALALITVILGLSLGKDFSAILGLTTCALLSLAAVSCLEPILDFLWEVNRLGDLQDGFLKILLQCAGISLLGELTGMVCRDAGNGSLGKTLQMLGSGVILSLSIPVFRSVLALIQEIMGIL